MMGNWRFAAFAALWLSVQFAGPSESRHLQKRSDVSTDTLSTVVSQLTEQVTTTRAQVTAQEAKIASLKANLKKLNQPAAFHVYNTDDVPVRAHSPIIFSTARTNVGEGYDVKTGYFRAPVSGLYVFYANVMCADLTQIIHGSIYVDGVYVAGTNSDCRQHFYNSVSTDVIVHVSAGQKVNMGNPDDYTSVYSRSVFTTFSGFLLRAD